MIGGAGEDGKECVGVAAVEGADRGDLSGLVDDPNRSITGMSDDESDDDDERVARSGNSWSLASAAPSFTGGISGGTACAYRRCAGMYPRYRPAGERATSCTRADIRLRTRADCKFLTSWTSASPGLDMCVDPLSNCRIHRAGSPSVPYVGLRVRSIASSENEGDCSKLRSFCM